MNLAGKLGIIYLVSEVILRFSRRSSESAEKSDRGSLLGLWVAIGMSVVLSAKFTHWAPRAAFAMTPTMRTAMVVVFAIGLLIRWWSIISLGKFFTVDVAIAADHRLVVRGPYRFARHPSYSGMMLAFVAYGVILQNWVSLIVLLVPISVALGYRIRIEETALLGAFKEEYVEYSRRTKRLIPAIF